MKRISVISTRYQRGSSLKVTLPVLGLTVDDCFLIFKVLLRLVIVTRLFFVKTIECRESTTHKQNVFSNMGN